MTINKRLFNSIEDCQKFREKRPQIKDLTYTDKVLINITRTFVLLIIVVLIYATT